MATKKIVISKFVAIYKFPTSFADNTDSTNNMV